MRWGVYMELNGIYKYEIGLDQKYKKRYGIEYVSIDYAISMAELAIDTWLETHKIESLLDIKIYDPCAGTGILEIAMLAVVQNRLSRAGIKLDTKKWIENSLYMADIDKDALDILKQVLTEDNKDIKLNISCGDVLFNGIGVKELVPAFKDDSWYWKELMEGSDNTEDDEWGEFGEQVNILSLRDKKEEYYREALALNGIEIGDTSGLSICELDNLEVFKEHGGFDIVMMFVPNIKMGTCYGNKDELLGYKVYNGNANIGVYFMEYGFNKLNKDGIAVVLSHNDWIDSKYAVECRRWLKGKLRYIAQIDNKNIMLLKNGTEQYKSLLDGRGALKNNLKGLLDSRDLQNYDGVTIEIYDYISSGIRHKYHAMMKQGVVGDYTKFKTGITVKDMKSLLVSEEMYKKYPGLVKKVMTANREVYMVALPKGIYTEDSIPKEIMSLLEARGKNFIEDIELQYEASRVSEKFNCVITDNFEVKEIDTDVLVVSNNLICGNADEWLLKYLKNPYLQTMYDLNNHKNVSANSINNIPVPLNLAENTDIEDDDIIDGFNLTDAEVIKMGLILEDLQ